MLSMSKLIVSVNMYICLSGEIMAQLPRSSYAFIMRFHFVFYSLYQSHLSKDSLLHNYLNKSFFISIFLSRLFHLSYQ